MEVEEKKIKYDESYKPNEALKDQYAQAIAYLSKCKQDREEKVQ